MNVTLPWSVGQLRKKVIGKHFSCKQFAPILMLFSAFTSPFQDFIPQILKPTFQPFVPVPPSPPAPKAPVMSSPALLCNSAPVLSIHFQLFSTSLLIGCAAASWSVNQKSPSCLSVKAALEQIAEFPCSGAGEEPELCVDS